VKPSGEVESKSEGVALQELVDNADVIQSWRPEQAAALRFDTTQDIEDEPHYFCLTVTLANDHRAWSSPIWVNHPGPAP
jgi:hypothetical protein